MFRTLGFGDLKSTFTSGTSALKTLMISRWILEIVRLLEKLLSSADFWPTTLLRHCSNHDSDCIDVQVMCQTCQCCVPCEVNDETRCFQLPKKAGGFPVTTCQRGRANLKFRLAHPTVFLDLSWIWWWNWAGSWWGFYPTGVKTAFFFGYDQTWDIGWIQSTYIAQWEKTCRHAAMVSWLVEVSCLTRCQLGDDKLRWVESNLNNQVSIVDS